MMQTRGQRFAEHAIQCVEEQIKKKNVQAYKSFALKFPALLHNAGLAQGISFAVAKGDLGACYVSDLGTVMELNFRSGKDIEAHIRSCDCWTYIRLSRTALEAAGWLKRYAEILIDDDRAKATPDDE